jgi:hypothetical protein
MNILPFCGFVVRRQSVRNFSDLSASHTSTHLLCSPFLVPKHSRVLVFWAHSSPPSTPNRFPSPQFHVHSRTPAKGTVSDSPPNPTGQSQNHLVFTILYSIDSFPTYALKPQTECCMPVRHDTDVGGYHNNGLARQHVHLHDAPPAGVYLQRSLELRLPQIRVNKRW